MKEAWLVVSTVAIFLLGYMFFTFIGYIIDKVM